MRKSTNACLVVVVSCVWMVAALKEASGSILSEVESLKNAMEKQKSAMREESVKESVSVEGDWGLATSLTGTYYLSGDTSKCFVIRANPNGNERGFAIESSAGIAATFLSGAGTARAQYPIRGAALIYTATGFKEVKVYAVGTGVNINGVTYLRRLDSASWTCTILSYGKNGPISGAWMWMGLSDPNFCQIIEQDTSTGAFVMYYPDKISALLEAGAGVFDGSKNSGFLGGYNPGGRDGPYAIKLNTAKNFLMFNNNPSVGLKKMASCHSANYPTVSQTPHSVDATQYKWVATTATSCESVCASKNMAGVDTGLNKNTGKKYYVCRARQKTGLVPGMNEVYSGHGNGKYCILGPVHHFVGNYECLCQPKGTTSKWVTNGQVYKSCQDACLVNGYDALPAGKSHDLKSLASNFICSTCWNSGGWGCRPGFNLAQTGEPRACQVAWTGTGPDLFSCLCVTQKGQCPF